MLIKVAVRSQFRVEADGRLTADMSDLGIGPGEWPDRIRIAPEGELFVMFGEVRQGGDVQSVHYEGPAGKRLTLFND